MPSLTIRPGSRIRLKGQSDAVPDFLVVHCNGEFCWIRQENWRLEMGFSVKVTQISIPEETAAGENKVIYLARYRQQKQARQIPKSLPFGRNRP